MARPRQISPRTILTNCLSRSRPKKLSSLILGSINWDVDLDQEVLQKIVGWQIEGSNWISSNGSLIPVSKTPKISSDSRLALRLVDLLKGKYCGEFTLSSSSMVAPCMRWEARFGAFSRTAETAAEAICLAALEMSMVTCGFTAQTKS